MNSKIIIGIALALSLAAGGYFLISNNLDPGTNSGLGNNGDNTITPESPIEAEVSTENKAINDRYIVYDEEHFNESAARSRRVLFFYASWCPTCRPADAEFETNQDMIPADVVLYRVNYDTEDALKEKYGITYQHTFVQLDPEGNEVAKWNGGSFDELMTNLR